MGDATCSGDDCNERRYCKGLCVRCYERMRKWGTTKPRPKVVKICSVQTCPERARARGWCVAHYATWYATGDPEWKPASLEERFWENVQKTDNGCWTWTGPHARGGYGRFSFGNKSRLAHRVSYEMFVGPIPEEMTIDHQCHNRDRACRGGTGCRHRLCIRPEHLELATRGVNARRGKGSRATCKYGHEFTPENTLINGKGHRWCRTCRDSRNASRPKVGGRVYVRKTHCKRNHEFTPENTGYNKQGGQVCKACKRLRNTAQSRKAA